MKEQPKKWNGSDWKTSVDSRKRDSELSKKPRLGRTSTVERRSRPRLKGRKYNDATRSRSSEDCKKLRMPP